jgi:hypothetical protein
LAPFPNELEHAVEKEENVNEQDFARKNSLFSLTEQPQVSNRKETAISAQSLNTKILSSETTIKEHEYTAAIV